MKSNEVKFFLLKLKSTSFYQKICKESVYDPKLNMIFSNFLFNLLILEDIRNIAIELTSFFAAINFTENELDEIEEIFSELNIDFTLPSKEEIAKISFDYDNFAVKNEMTKPFESWIWDGSKWESPVPYPTTGYSYIWDESAKEWNKV